MLANPYQHAEKEQAEQFYRSCSAICLRRLQTWTLVSKGLVSYIIAIIGFGGLNSISKGCVFAGVKLVAECFCQAHLSGLIALLGRHLGLLF